MDLRERIMNSSKQPRTYFPCYFVLGLSLACATFTRAETLSNVFTGSINVSSGLIDGFFVGNGSSTTPLPGVCVGPENFASDPLNPLNTTDGLFHPSGFNPRRVMSAFNPSLNGGTIFIGIDLPGGTGSAANPNFNDGVIPARSVGGLTAIRPFDADGNGEPETIGRTLGGGLLQRCAGAMDGDSFDIINCTDVARNGAFSDAATDPGTSEGYVVTVIFNNGTFVTVSLTEDQSSGAGAARRDIGQTAGKPFGAQVSTATLGSGPGAPQGLDVLFAITNVNANVDACTRLIQQITASSGSNRDGVGHGEPFKSMTCTYVLPAAIECEVLLFTNSVQVTENGCDNPDPNAVAGIVAGDTVEIRVVVTAPVANPQDIASYTINISGCEPVAGGPLAPGQSVTNSVCFQQCTVPGVHNVMASVSATGAITDDCVPIETACDSAFQCCGQPNASFSGAPTSGLAPLMVTFSDTSTGTITNRFWDFGDGVTTNTMATNVVHTYTLAGTNTVTLIAQGPGGASTNTRPQYIVVSTETVYPIGDVNADFRVTGTDSLLINQVLVGLRSSNSAIFAAGYENGDVNRNGHVTGADSLLINQVAVGLRSYVVTRVLPGSRTNTAPVAVTIYGIGFPTNAPATVMIGPPVDLVLSNVVVQSREQISALVPTGGGSGTGIVSVVATPTNGVVSFGEFINP
jgi:PKD repeat protein